jgi:arylsulfatase A-like enzyme/Flp pilus assembly protein TadD
VAAACSSGLLLSCPSFSQRVRNVLLVSIDTCRADHLGCYGHPGSITPNIDRIAEEGIVFSNAYSPVPMTLPAHSSMLTGTVPPHHGVRDNFDHKLGHANETLAEVLDRAGFVTGAIVSAFVLDSQFGLDQGFQTYQDRFEAPIEKRTVSERRGEETSRLALEWLEGHGNERFFLFLHYYDPHTDYAPPEPFASRFPGYPYAGEIAYTDHCIGRVIEGLKDLGLYDSTLIIITSDHGEMLGEHGELDHGYFIYQSAIRVPLIFRLPGRQKGGRIDGPVGIVDVVPTVCSILGIGAPDPLQGRDLSGSFDGGEPPDQERHLYCESLLATKYGANPLQGVVGDRWKYIRTTRPEMYDLIEDPDEADDLAEQRHDQARLLQERLGQTLAEAAREADSESRAVLDEAGRRRLESLGYLDGASVSEDPGFDPGWEDPKDLISFHRLLTRALGLIAEGKLTEARAICEKLLAERPRDPQPHLYLAKIATAQGDFSGAVSYLTEAVRLRPDARAHIELGTALIALGETEEAIGHFEKAIRIEPDAHHEPYFNLGNALAKQGKVAEAIRRYSDALRIHPGFAETHNNLALLLLKQGGIAEAVEHFSEAVRINPDYAEAHVNLGLVLSRQGRAAEAIEHFTEAVRIRPDFAEVHNSLGVALAKQGRTTEAVHHFSEAVRIKPDFDDAHNNLGVAFTNRGRTAEAIRSFSEAVRINPDNAKARDNLEKVLAVQRIQDRGER